MFIVYPIPINGTVQCTVHCTLSSNYILMAALEMSQFLEGIDHNTDQK